MVHEFTHGGSTVSEAVSRAVIDVGSNTIRLLVAVAEDNRVEKLLDQSEFVRLGLGVDRSGRLAQDREQAAIAAIAELSERARAMGAHPIVGVATSAVRDAANGPQFVQAVQRETGTEVRILSGREEAHLTYLGATMGLTESGTTLIVDLGGGSGELILANEGHVDWAESVPLGSGRLTERFIHSDPPTQEELAAVSSYVSSILESLARAQPHRAVFTGGTATHVAWIAGHQDTTVHLDEKAILHVLSTVTSQTGEAVVRRFGIRQERAQVLPAGVATLLDIVRFYRPSELIFTQSGIREGVLLESVRHDN
jgi:exopolyphosphatase / guanosine-5'-triphosphate,3'-diphosphate pyrophosphatase